jgi:hypothetical protein
MVNTLMKAGAIGGMGGMNAGAWVAGPDYGLIALGAQLATVALVVTLLVIVPEERSDRVFRFLRLALDRPKPPEPPRHPM